jgi:gas vesicle protein
VGHKTKPIMNTGKVVLGALAGLAIGAIAGILFAPDKGSATRKKIMDKGDDYVYRVKSKFNGIVDSITEKFESTKNDVDNLAEMGKAKYDEAKRDVKNAAANFS